jgi:hypothetical protein
VTEDPIQLGDEVIQPRIIDLKARKCCNVPHVIMCDCHQT